MPGFNGAVEGGALHGYDVVDNLTSTETQKPLSAAMGKTLEEHIQQSTAFESTTVSGTTSADGLLKLNMSTWQHLIVELYSRSYICLLYPDDYGQFWAKVLDYNMAKVASTSVTVGVRYKTIM